MRAIHILTLIAAVSSGATYSSNASADDEGGGTAHTSDSDFHIGVGAGISLLSPVLVGGGATALAGPFSGGSLVIPMDIAGVIRVEPEVSVFHYTEGDDTNDVSATTAKVGVGIMYMFGIGGDAQGTVGARLGPQFVNSSNTGPDGMGGNIETSRSAINFSAGPALGGEYFPSEYFSIGAEAQLNFIYIGEEDVAIDPGPDPGGNDQTGFAAHTNAVVFARAFFL